MLWSFISDIAIMIAKFLDWVFLLDFSGFWCDNDWICIVLGLILGFEVKYGKMDYFRSWTDSLLNNMGTVLMASDGHGE